MATQIDLGAVVPIGKGDWNPSTTYERANIVRHNSVAWICKVATSLGVEPTETSSDWYLLVKDTSSVTSINRMRGDVTIDSVLENPSIDDNSLKIASTAWANTKISQVDSKAEEALSKTGLPLGHIYLWPFSTPPDGSIQLNGSTYSRELYSDLWNLIQTKGWYKPEAEWQSIASANGGYCPWYSDGDGSTTFRVPKFAPYQKLALASSDAGKYYNAGLPNITGHFSATDNICLNGNSTATPQVFRNNDGCFSLVDGAGARALVSNHTVNTYTDNRRVTFSASKSNGIYGNSDTVQPESHDWIVCVVAFGKATNVGSVDVANVMSAISQVQSEINIILPVGSVIASATNATPDGYLICNGAAISRTTYAALFAAIGTIYGIGDGSTTFNLPNLVDRFIQGSGTSGTVIDAGAPDIQGNFVLHGSEQASIIQGASGAMTLRAEHNSYRTPAQLTENPNAISGGGFIFRARSYNSIYGNSDTVQPPALTMRYYIKY